MTAQSIDTFVLAFSDPALNAPEPQRSRVNVSISFELFDNDHLRTLSTSTVSNGEDIEGLLYVPDLHPSDPCTDASKPFIPSNVTRKANLPSEQNTYIAFAPWISAPCTISYLTATDGVEAFMTYVPNNRTDTPPLANDETWDLHDGGQWKSENKFPVYALPGAEGAAIMQQLGHYSGDSSNAQIRYILEQERFDPTDYVRLYTSFGTSGSSNLPTLWAFLLIVLGLICLLVGTTSFLMHLIQRRRRRDLQRRVENGEVDLETLGIKRTFVPQEAIDALPTSIYPDHEEKSNRKIAPASVLSSELSVPTSSADRSQWSQPTCPICLEDFIPNTTTIRSLPCHHIFHPPCIDPFLRKHSSLCPVCKARVLPSSASYKLSEPITNVMVRHERRIRRMRQGREAGRLPNRPAVGEEGEDGRWNANFGRGYQIGRRALSGPSDMAGMPTTSQVEMGMVERRAASGQAAARAGAPPEVEGELRAPPPTDGNLRREWMRRRLNKLRGPDRTVNDERTERLAGLPRWRKAIGAVFPGCL